MIRTIVRFVVSALVLIAVSWVVPGMRVVGFTNALLAAVVIAALGWVAEQLLGKESSPQSRGIVSFLVAAAVIYLTQFVVGGVEVSILGALIAAFVIGLVDAVVPTELR